jgi:hypothetical protein
MMRLTSFIALTVVLVAISAFAAETSSSDTFSHYVDKAGNIKVPTNYRNEWAYLGTWSIASKEVGGGAAGMHVVYTQPDSIEAYRKTGKFPDGALLIKELLETGTQPLSTGKASWGAKVTGWFVMVKDSKGRFPDNRIWGDGWGWSYFDAEEPSTSPTKDYKAECLNCHIPAKQTDWIYTYGYPRLNQRKVGG